MSHIATTFTFFEPTICSKSLFAWLAVPMNATFSRPLALVLPLAAARSRRGRPPPSMAAPAAVASDPWTKRRREIRFDTGGNPSVGGDRSPARGRRDTTRAHVIRYIATGPRVARPHARLPCGPPAHRGPRVSRPEDRDNSI